jgi:integrase
MSALEKYRNKYYARITKYNSITKKQELIKKIPLLTDSKLYAKKRKNIVDVNEQLIKDGEIVDIDNFFPWLNQRGQSKITEMNLEDASNRWIESRDRQPNLRKRTLEINKVAVNHMLSSWGKTIPIAQLKPKDVRYFIERYSASHNHSVTTININLRTINTFFKWLVEQDYINKMPNIHQLRVNESEVKYLSESDIALLLKSDLSKRDSQGRFIKDWNHYQKVFSMYIATGMRRVEPLLGTINGQWLDIPPSESKTHKKRTIKIDDANMQIVNEMREKAFTKKNLVNEVRHLSNVFRRARRMLGLNDELTLHSLRHTYGCIRRLQTNGNMILVRDEMGHKNLRTTERYCNIPIDRLADDFPSYVKTTEIDTLIPQINTTDNYQNKKD